MTGDTIDLERRYTIADLDDLPEDGRRYELAGGRSPVDELFTAYLPPGMLDARRSGRRGPFASDGGMQALLEAAGCVDVRNTHLTVQARFADAVQWHDFSWSHGQRAMWEAVPPGQREDLRQRAVSLLEDSRNADGTLSLRQDVRYTLGRHRRT